MVEQDSESKLDTIRYLDWFRGTDPNPNLALSHSVMATMDLDEVTVEVGVEVFPSENLEVKEEIAGGREAGRAGVTEAVPVTTGTGREVYEEAGREPKNGKASKVEE